ncbi:RAD50 DNA repair protein, putative [Giardia lamblia P15]|uniref:RAD50 DNA repair protein, putative n=1 Tax=Giardia intestinalis (strain P15) TaxID=658858 RepID=E1F137_GIAIA|nr:RAD50 DNA repair protein, putative [Giardia lamblia P15]
MYYLDQLTLKNVRSYRDEPSTIAFSPNLTIITGHNGAGKSTLLEALLYLLSQERPMYDRIEPKVASENAVMLMQCILRRESNTSEVNSKPIEDPSFEPPLKDAVKCKKSSKGKSSKGIPAASLKGNQVLLELTRTIKRAGRDKVSSTRRNRIPDSPELSSALQLCDGLFQYCLICSVTKSHWMFETPEEISKSTDQILNLDRFTKLSKEFHPPPKELASSEVCYTAALKAVANQEGELYQLSKKIANEEQCRNKLRTEHDLLTTFTTDFASLTRTWVEVSKLLGPCASNNWHQDIAKDRRSCQMQLADLPISTFLSQKVCATENSLFLYLTLRSEDNVLAETYTSIIKAHNVSGSHIQLDDATSIFSKLASDSVLQESMLLARWERLKVEYDPQSIPRFVDKYRDVLTLLSTIKNSNRDITTTVAASDNVHINTKYNLIESFYQNIMDYPSGLEPRESLDNISNLENLCLELSMICMKVSAVDDVINSNIAQKQCDLEAIKESITVLDNTVSAEESRRKAISILVSLSSSLSDKLVELQSVEYEQSSKRNRLQDLSSRCANLRMSITQQQNVHERLLYLCANHYVSSEELTKSRDALNGLSLLAHLPALLLVTLSRQRDLEKDIGSVCRFVILTWKESWTKLRSCLDRMGYPHTDTLTSITEGIASECLTLLNNALNFINDKIQDCIGIELRSFFSVSNSLSGSLTKMVSSVADALQNWLTTTGNIITVIPTLRNDFSVYIKRRARISEKITKDMLVLFENFLDEYKQDVARRKADLVDTIVSALDAFSNIVPIALGCQNLNISFDKVHIELFELEKNEQIIRKIMLNNDEISSIGDRADDTLYQILYNVPINTVTCDSFPLLTPQLAYQSVDCCAIMDTINAFFDKLILAAKYFESTRIDSEYELDSLKIQLNDEENSRVLAKQEFEELESHASSIQLEISELKQQFLTASIDGQPYSVDYAQKLVKEDMQIGEKLKHYGEERCKLLLKIDTLKEELDALTLDATQISLPRSATMPLTHAGFLDMKKALERIKKSPSITEVESAESSYQIAHDKTLRLQTILAILKEYAIVDEFLSKLLALLDKVRSQFAESIECICCRELLDVVKRTEDELTNKCPTLGNVSNSLVTMLSLYENAKNQLAMELYKKEGVTEEQKKQHERLKNELHTAVEKYAQSKASLLIVKGASALSMVMQRTVKEFKHMLLKKLNSKLQSLWNQCYARTGTARNEISTVRLAITQVGTGDKAKDVIELQAICTNPNTDCPVIRSFREACSSGQQVLLSILLRLSFSYISMSPFSFIVLDEPTNYLDKENNKNLAHVLADFISSEQNTQVVIITHSLEFCDALIAATNNINTRTYKISMESGGSAIHEIEWGVDDNLTY